MKKEAQRKNSEVPTQSAGEELWVTADQYSNLCFAASRALLALLMSKRDPHKPLSHRGFDHGLWLCERLQSGARAAREGVKTSEQLVLIKAVQSLANRENETVDQLIQEAESIAAILAKFSKDPPRATDKELDKAIKFFDTITEIYGDETQHILKRVMQPACF